MHEFLSDVFSNPKLKYVYLTIAIIAEVIATTTLKDTEGFTKLKPTILIFVFYLISLYLLSVTLNYIPVGIVYAIWAGAGIVFVAIAGFVVHGQKLDWPAIAGIGLITIGIIVINLFSKSSVH